MRWRCRPGDEAGNWWLLFHEARALFGGRSVSESARARLRLVGSAGCIRCGVKVTACLLRVDRGSSLESGATRGGEVKGVSQRLKEKSEEESEGRSLLAELVNP